MPGIDEAERALERADEAFARFDIEAVITHLSTAIRGFTAADEKRRAAMACVQLGEIFANALGNLTASRAWFSRARRLVENEPPCLEQGWVAVAAMGCDVDDPAELLAAAELALDRLVGIPRDHPGGGSSDGVRRRDPPAGHPRTLRGLRLRPPDPHHLRFSVRAAGRARRRLSMARLRRRGAAFCDAHHALHWGDLGETEPDNLALLCWHHHHCLHEQHFSLEPLGAGHFQIHTPFGTTHDTRPPRLTLLGQ